MQSSSGAGRRAEAGPVTNRLFFFSPTPSFLPFASLQVFSSRDAELETAAGAGREERPGPGPRCARAAPPRSAIARARKKRPKFARRAAVAPPYCLQTSLPSPAAPDSAEAARLPQWPRGAASAPARLDGHARGPEPGRGAAGSSNSPCPGAAALSGAGTRRAPPCNTRTRACGWCCRL